MASMFVPAGKAISSTAAYLWRCPSCERGETPLVGTSRLAVRRVEQAGGKVAIACYVSGNGKLRIDLADANGGRCHPERGSELMVALMPPQTVLTPNSAANNLQAQGLDALGLAGPSLSPMWAGSNAAAADYDPAALTLRLANPRAAWRGIADWRAAPALFSDPTGAPLTGQALVLTLHPQAVQRLQAEIDLRTNSTVYSVPTAMVVRGLAPPATLPPSQIYLAGETLGTGTGLATFHDSRGLIIDPVALACLFNDLIGWRSALMGTTIPGWRLADRAG
jgi:hypothetical protein